MYPFPRTRHGLIQMKDDKSTLEKSLKAWYDRKYQEDIDYRNRGFKESADVFNKWLQGTAQTKFKAGDLAILNNQIVYIVEVQPKGYITQPRRVQPTTGRTTPNALRASNIYLYKHLGKAYSSSTIHSDGQTSETYLTEIPNE